MLGPFRRLARDSARLACTVVALSTLGACASPAGGGAQVERGGAVSLAAGVEVVVPGTAAAATVVRSGPQALAFTLRHAAAVPFQGDDDGWVAARAAPGGGDVRLRRRSGGLEDWVTIPGAEVAPDALRYDVDLSGAAGLRAVGGVVEVLDEGGTPRLRVGPAAVVDAAGETRAAALDIEGCAADRSAAPPWGRQVTAPGAARCTVVVRWDARGLRYPLAVDPPWTATSALAVVRLAHTATRLESGRVLVVGSSVSDLSEIYDPATRTWAAGGTLSAARRSHVAALLPDGQVLVAGGVVAGATSASAERYDPTTGTFTASGSLGTARHAAAAASLADGRLLVTGGFDASGGGNQLASCEVYDPVGGTFAPTGSMALDRAQHTATALADGRVLALGTWGQQQPELWSPVTGAWSATAPIALGLEDHTATLLGDGRVLVVGGRTGGGLSTTDAVSVFDPTSDGWSAGPNLPGPIARRRGHAAALLLDGRLAIVGGDCDHQCALGVNTAQHDDGLIWTPGGSAGSWAHTSGPTSAQRTDATATTLESGNVLVVGYDTSEELCLAEGCACTLATECYSGHCVDGFCCDSACTGTCTACSAALKKQGDDGECGPIGPGVDPQNECASAGADSCGLDGACDGAGACRFHAAGTVCAASSCIDEASEVHADTCDGAGSCVDNGSGPCGQGYLCASDACAGSCVQAANCAPGYECIAGACTKRPNGAACDGEVQCVSGNCVDGVCCDGTCQGQCESCAEPGALGACTPVSGEPRGERQACAPGQPPCEATCSGVDPQACALPGAEVSCGFGRVCDGAGACVQPDTLCSADRRESIDSSGEATSCAPYLCDPSTGACATSCTSASQCVDTAFCDDKRCQAGSDAPADDGGCSAAPGRAGGIGGALWLMALAVMARLRRRRLASAAGLVVLACAACSAGSEAEVAPGAGADGVDRTGGDVVVGAALRLSIPARADGTLHVADVGSGVGVAVSLLGAGAAEIERGSGVARYRGGAPGGGDVRLRFDARGVEDFVTVAHPAAASELRYRFAPEGTAGLRLVGGRMELLDAGGRPRLRVPRPFVVDAAGARFEATLALEGCAADRDPRAPLGRAPTPPGAASCELVVRWPRGLAHPIEVDPGWTTTTGPGDITDHATVLLADGRLMLVGGGSSEVQLFDAGVFMDTTSMFSARIGPTATLLADGRVLVAGGNTATAEIYNAALAQWSPAAVMGTSRQGHSAVLLADGSVLVVGGDAAGSSARYVPAADTWIAAGPVGNLRLNHTLTLLADGRALLVGGSNDPAIAKQSRIYTVNSGWADGPALQEPRTLHMAALLPGGEVLVAGGTDLLNGPGALASVELFDPVSETFSPGVAMLGNRRDGVLLPFGAGAKLYLIGGRPGGGESPDTAVYDVASATWSLGEPMTRPRAGHTADLLPTGEVLVIGGGPPEMFPPCDIQCIDIGCSCLASTCLVGTCVDGVCCDGACSGGCQACSAAKKGVGQDGQCGPIADGADPDDECALSGVETCGTLGFCDGMGACRLYAAGTECAEASCISEALLLPAAACDGGGDCVTPAPVACQSGSACGDGACSATCRDDDDCGTGFVCSAGLCVQKAPGDPCSAGSECATGVCADGVCCDAPCTGQCESCAAPGTAGLCVQVKGAPVSKGPCAGEGTCQGVCDEDRAACTFPDGSCGPASTCSNGVCVQTAPVCSGDGASSISPAGETTPCTPYRCDPLSGVCLDACTVSAQCGDAFACVEGQCLDASSSGGSGEPPADEGCDCRTAAPRAPRGASGALLLTMALFLLSVRRRKRLQPRA